jgi:16S rRNA processing protein RimM
VTAGRGAEGGDDVTVGRIGAPRGVRGDVFVQPFTDDPGSRFAVGTRLRTDPPAAGPLTVAAANDSGAKLVLHFDGVDDREGAQALRGVRLVISRSERPALDDPDEFYADDLVGLDAVTVDGTGLGPIREVVDVAGADYLVVEVDGRERLVPFVSAIVPTVDLAARRVVIDPPEGLFEL